MLVNVAEIISSSSQGMRAFQMLHTDCFKYGFSFGSIAAIF